jgi:hypothetical protein
MPCAVRGAAICSCSFESGGVLRIASDAASDLPAVVDRIRQVEPRFGTTNDLGSEYFSCCAGWKDAHARRLTDGQRRQASSANPAHGFTSFRVRSAIRGQVQCQTEKVGTLFAAGAWSELRRNKTFDRAIFEHSGVCSAQEICSDPSGASSSLRGFHEKYCSSYARDFGTARRDVDIIPGRGRRSNAHVFTWTLLGTLNHT